MLRWDFIFLYFHICLYSFHRNLYTYFFELHNKESFWTNECTVFYIVHPHFNSLRENHDAN